MLLKEESTLEVAEAFLRRHLSEPITLADIAAATSLPVTSLTRYFRLRAGISPMKWVWEFRLDQASRLMLETDWSISKIATQTGFVSLPHFSRRFHQKFGECPSQWRIRRLERMRAKRAYASALWAPEA